MASPDTYGSDRADSDRLLRTILEATAGRTGVEFFRALAKGVAEALGLYGAWVCEFSPEVTHLETLAFWLGDDFVEGYRYALAGTPCEAVIGEQRLVHIPDRLIELFPDQGDLRMIGAVSYIGIPLLDTDDESILGHLAALHVEPLPETPRALAVFRIFAAQAAAELRRLRAEADVRDREETLRRLVDSAMDAIVGFDAELNITRANRAATKVFGASEDRLRGSSFSRFLSLRSRLKLRRLMDELDARPEAHRSLWISGGLDAVRASGASFPAEATLSRFDAGGGTYYTLILRDVDARRRAERQLRSLTAETEYLREEIRALENFDEIIGESEPLLRVMRDVQRVAGTDATVLILGETGTGKELFARAIHEGSERRGKPLVRVNCAAMPANLIESELFGHEKGAFTGATTRREGRFALADGGTIFLDEVGEIPLELQTKLLRVLQDGEFEPVGGERSRTVDVRVIAATNRDLRASVREGEFREDLFYRLNVFPIDLPPLRQRGNDVALLAAAFAERFARRMGRAIDPLTAADIARLRTYPWPGNVRELQNVIERAVITARDGRMDLVSVLPDSPATTAHARPGTIPAEAAGDSGNDQATPPKIYTVDEMKELERDNIRRALEATDWQVAGDDGAARLLGLPPSTLSSRIRSLGLQRPTP